MIWKQPPSVSDPERNETEPLVIDLKRTVAEIREARRQADIVVVSVHTHEMRGRDTMVPPEFLETFAHACVDAGASAVIGHGPHQLRGLEIYKGAPVFYSIGNFIFETPTLALLYFLVIVAIFILTAHESFIKLDFSLKLLFHDNTKAFTNTLIHEPRSFIGHGYSLG